MDFKSMSKEQIQQYVRQQLSNMTPEQKRQFVKTFCSFTKSLHDNMLKIASQNLSSEFIQLIQDPEPNMLAILESEALIDRLKLK